MQDSIEDIKEEETETEKEGEVEVEIQVEVEEVAITTVELIMYGEKKVTRDEKCQFMIVLRSVVN